jgi:hypothetical protein
MIYRRQLVLVSVIYDHLKLTTSAWTKLTEEAAESCASEYLLPESMLLAMVEACYLLIRSVREASFLLLDTLLQKTCCPSVLGACFDGPGQLYVTDLALGYIERLLDSSHNQGALFLHSKWQRIKLQPRAVLCSPPVAMHLKCDATSSGRHTAPPHNM